MSLLETLSLISIIISPLIGLICFMLWKKIEAMDKEQTDMADRVWKEVKELGTEVNNIKSNSMDRFTDLKNCITSFELKFIERVTRLETILNKGKE